MKMATVTSIMDVLLSHQCVTRDVCIGLVMLATRKVTAPKRSWNYSRTCMGGQCTISILHMLTAKRVRK